MITLVVIASARTGQDLARRFPGIEYKRRRAAARGGRRHWMLPAMRCMLGRLHACWAAARGAVLIAARSTVDCCGRRRHNPPPAAYTAAAVGAA